MEEDSSKANPVWEAAMLGDVAACKLAKKRGHEMDEPDEVDPDDDQLGNANFWLISVAIPPCITLSYTDTQR